MRYPKHRLIALLTFLIGMAAVSYFQSPPEILGRFQVMVPPIPKPVDPSVPMPHSCGHIVVSIHENGSLQMNTEEIGTLDDTREMSERLKEIFRQRAERRVYAEGMESRTDLPEGERIFKVVYIKAP